MDNLRNSQILDDPFPERVYDYLFQKELGRGSFGVVCLYKHQETGEEVAIKLEHHKTHCSTLTGESIIMKKLKDS